MPIINEPLVYSEASLAKINEKMAGVGYSHLDWSAPELEDVRCEIRNHYRDVQRLQCVYCQGAIMHRSAAGAPVEHIVPKSQYLSFMFEPKNLCVICPDCNEYKGAQEVLMQPVMVAPRVNYPTSSNAFRIVHPHYDEYEDHIMRHNRVYVDRSVKGGYTIFLCNLNRFYRRFGRCDEFVNDVALVERSERFYDEGRVDI
ncbi:HNH endonuclease family protein [Pseudomonas chlororaphis]|uniref:HNH endonuclease n=1 Tax=Pseudomonas chlororaphis TaxID=587753 RepID=UPI000D11122C|nr:HNH endonuclease [Pseudomonas chlororaphis]AVO58240.1 HNH endonuclease [Pseudomonas chlororaphis subsp. piscium]